MRPKIQLKRGTSEQLKELDDLDIFYGHMACNTAFITDKKVVVQLTNFGRQAIGAVASRNAGPSEAYSVAEVVGYDHPRVEVHYQGKILSYVLEVALTVATLSR